MAVCRSLVDETVGLDPGMTADMAGSTGNFSCMIRIPVLYFVDVYRTTALVQPK